MIFLLQLAKGSLKHIDDGTIIDELAAQILINTLSMLILLKPKILKQLSLAA